MKRWSFVIAAWAAASTGVAQERTRPLEVTSFTYAPKGAQVGEEITITASLKNTTPRLLLANVRLIIGEQAELLLPEAEQIHFLEAGTSRDFRWRAKVLREGPLRSRVDPSVISEGRPLNGPQARISEPAMIALGQVWAGTWTSPAGYVYDAEFRAKVDPSGAVEGRLEWTLKKAPEERKDYADKIGAKGVEYVWGVFDAAARTLDLEGYRRDDPRVVLGLDRYRLTLAEDFGEIKGATWNHGTWKAAFKLSPK